MKRNNKATDKTTLVEKVASENETILVFKPTKRLTAIEHEQLTNKLRVEEGKSGIKIVLMPFSVELTKDSNRVSDEVLNELEGLREYKESAELELEELRKLKVSTEESADVQANGVQSKEGE